MINKILSADVLADILPYIIDLGLKALPYEAVGLITPNGAIIALDNEASERDTYLVSGHQLERALVPILGAQFTERKEALDFLRDLVIWHTHPSGHVGPSRADLKARREPPLNELAHLVVALPNGEVCYF